MKVAILAEFPLHFIPEFGERYRPGGHYATWLPQLAEAFESFPDLEIHWITLCSLLTTPMEVTWKKQKFHILPTETSSRATTLYAKDRHRIRTVLDTIRPHLVHGWGSEDVYGLAAVQSGFPNIVSMQGILSHYIFKTKMHPRVYLQALIEIFILWRAGCITVESAWGRACVLRRNPFARVSLVEYGVQPHFFDVAWTPDPEKPAAIFIGSITARKGIQDLVAAFRDPALAHAELRVVGGDAGEWGERLRAGAPDNVRWLGRKTSQEAAELLGRAWCLALPTRADTSPNVVKEARVIGLPVVSTPCGGQSSYVENGSNGFLVAPGDIRTLVDKLQSLLSNLDFCRSQGAYKHPEQRRFFDPHQTAEGFRRIYLERSAL